MFGIILPRNRISKALFSADDALPLEDVDLAGLGPISTPAGMTVVVEETPYDRESCSSCPVRTWTRLALLRMGLCTRGE